MTDTQFRDTADALWALGRGLHAVHELTVPNGDVVEVARDALVYLLTQDAEQ